MNWYFWSLLLYAICIVPVTAQVHVSYHHGIHYRIRFRAAGLPFYHTSIRPEQSIDSDIVTKKRRPKDQTVLIRLWQQGVLKRLLRSLHWHRLALSIRISLADAAQTAVLYAFLRTFWQAAQMIRTSNINATIEADFQGAGLQFSIRCIVSARLGRITAEAVRLWLVSARMQAERLKAEEANNAAAPH